MPVKRGPLQKLEEKNRLLGDDTTKDYKVQYKDRICEHIPRKSHAAIRTHNKFKNMVKNVKLRRFGHISLSSG